VPSELAPKDDLPILAFERMEDFEQWIQAHIADRGLWLKIAKKSSGVTTISYGEALEVALCYGWIDGQKWAYDATYFLQRFTPRRAKSVWSKINVEKVKALTRAGKMQPEGLAVVAAAKADGRWAAAYDSATMMAMPDDFAAALAARPAARVFWATLNRTNTYAFLYRIQSAKRPETRQARIEKFVAMLAAGEKLY
jgi:uncharacterized protein YdeI (YjbR/CyaY-like superfamily)